MTKRKIQTADDASLRDELDAEYDASSQVQLCKYALMLAGHILEKVHLPEQDLGVIQEGFLMNGQWQKGEVRMHDVRQISFRIHKLAKTSEDEMVSTALRVAGHAVAAAHMREHAMVASDYAVRLISLLYPGSMEEIRKERLWQISQLKEIRQTD